MALEISTQGIKSNLHSNQVSISGAEKLPLAKAVAELPSLAKGCLLNKYPEINKTLELLSKGERPSDQPINLSC